VLNVRYTFADALDKPNHKVKNHSFSVEKYNDIKWQSKNFPEAEKPPENRGRQNGDMFHT
jgi:hypothetical protein